MNHHKLVLLSKRHMMSVNSPIKHVLALELLRLSVSKFITEEIIAVLPSHSQFRLQNNLYLDLHGLVFETSIYHWQDQPGSDFKPHCVLFPHMSYRFCFVRFFVLLPLGEYTLTYDQVSHPSFHSFIHSFAPYRYHPTRSPAGLEDTKVRHISQFIRSNLFNETSSIAK